MVKTKINRGNLFLLQVDTQIKYRIQLELPYLGPPTLLEP